MMHEEPCLHHLSTHNIWLQLLGGFALRPPTAQNPAGKLPFPRFLVLSPRKFLATSMTVCNIRHNSTDNQSVETRIRDAKDTENYILTQVFR